MNVSLILNRNYFFTPVSALTSCPLSMTDGAARLLQEVLPNLPKADPLHDVYKRLVSRTDSWTSGQWMTERAGGSDVQNTETWAVHAPLSNQAGSGARLDGGEYLVSGFKFFSSATDADVAVLLAKTQSGKLSAFLAPLKKQVTDADGKQRTVTNGIHIHRLKNKLGTKQLPTAELELKDARAHLVGPLDGGVRTISHILNVTRSWAFMGSVSAMRRSLSISKSFAKARTVFGYPLWLLPLHLRTLAGVELKVRSSLQLSFFTLALVSFTENSYPPPSGEALYAPLPKQGEEAQVILRTLTATSKAVLSKTAVFAVQECMEAMGGVGYMDDPDEAENLARALRDISVNTIWEGTTNVLSSEVVRHLLNRNHLDIFNNWLQRVIPTIRDDLLREILLKSWNILHLKLSKNKEYLFDALANGRAIMFSLAWILSGLLLAVDAQRDQDGVAAEVAKRWIVDKEGVFRDYLIDEFGRLASTSRAQEGKERAQWDCQIVWGVEMPDIAPFGHRMPQGSKI